MYSSRGEWKRSWSPPDWHQFVPVLYDYNIHRESDLLINEYLVVYEASQFEKLWSEGKNIINLFELWLYFLSK